MHPYSSVLYISPIPNKISRFDFRCEIDRFCGGRRIFKTSRGGLKDILLDPGRISDPLVDGLLKPLVRKWGLQAVLDMPLGLSSELLR